MIKINLLPQQKRTKSTNVEKGAAFFILGILLMFASVYGVDYYFTAELDELQASVAAKQQTRGLLEKEVAVVNSVIQELKDIESGSRSSRTSVCARVCLSNTSTRSS
jgi:type IV pilus assembly protein PilN